MLALQHCVMSMQVLIPYIFRPLNISYSITPAFCCRLVSSGIIRSGERKQRLQGGSCLVARRSHHRASLPCSPADVRFLQSLSAFIFNFLSSGTATFWRNMAILPILSKCMRRIQGCAPLQLLGSTISLFAVALSALAVSGTISTSFSIQQLSALFNTFQSCFYHLQTQWVL
jgi:hypothetical protein